MHYSFGNHLNTEITVMMTQIGEVAITSPDGYYNYNFSVKCVLYKPDYALIEGNHYQCGFKTKVVQILVSFQTLNAVMAILDSLGLAEWQLLDWWEVQEFALEPAF